MKKSIVIAAAAAILLALASCKSADDDVYPILQGTPVVPGQTISDMINSKEVTDFSNGTCSEDVVITRACVVKNANFNGKTITIKASKVVLENIKNVNIIVDESVGDGDFTANSSDILNLIVNGGGSNSIHVKNSTVATVSVSKEGVRIALEGTSSFASVEIKVGGIKFDCSAEAVIQVLNVAKEVAGFSLSGGTLKTIKKEDPNAQLIVSLSGKVKIEGAEGITFVKSSDSEVDLPEGVEVKSASESLNRGIDLLVAKDYDSAVKEFRAAYEAEKTDDTRMYYALTDLATFSVSKEVKDLAENHMGIENYPAELNSLINGDWLKDYAEKDAVVYQNIEKVSKPYDYNDAYSYYIRVSGEAFSFNDVGYVYTGQDSVFIQFQIDEEGDWLSDYDTLLRNPVADSNGKYLIPLYRYLYFIGKQDFSKKDIEELDADLYEVIGEWIWQFKKINSKFLGFKVPEWLKNNDAYKSSIFKSQETTATAMILLIANLLEGNGNGANEAVDAVLSLITKKLETVKSLASEMSNTSVIVPARLIETLNLTSYLGDDTVKIGKTELNVLGASLEVIKAALEYVSSYDLSCNITPLKSGLCKSDEEMFNAIKQLDTKKLLAVRNEEMVSKSKETLTNAITTAVSSYDEILSSPLYPQVVKDKLQEYGSAYYNGAKELLSAIKNGSTIYLTEESGKLFTTSDTGLAGIDLGKFFTAGALKDLLERDASGNIQFYEAFKFDYIQLFPPIIVGFGSGLTYTELGSTYEGTKNSAIEKISNIPDNAYSMESYRSYIFSGEYNKETHSYTYNESLLKKFKDDPSIDFYAFTVKPNVNILNSVFRNVRLNDYGFLDTDVNFYSLEIIH